MSKVMKSSCSSDSSSSPSPNKQPEQRRPLSPATFIADFDSDTDEEYYCLAGVKEMDREVWAKYDKQIKDSEGFDIKDYSGHCIMVSHVPILFEKSPKETKILSDLASLAIKEYNKSLRRTRYDFLKLETVVSTVCSGVVYNITFQAKERKRRNPSVKTFQARVWEGITQTTVDFCRLKKMPHQKVDSELHGE